MKGVNDMEFFKKGQMVPKRIGMVFVHKQARHAITFGCDVMVDGNTITAITEGTIITVRARVSREMNNGTRRHEIVSFIGAEFVGIPYVTRAAVGFYDYQ